MKKLLGLTTAVAVCAVSSVSIASNLWNETTSAVTNTTNQATKAVTNTAKESVEPIEKTVSYDPIYKGVVEVAKDPSDKNLEKLGMDTAADYGTEAFVGEEMVNMTASDSKAIGDTKAMKNQLKIDSESNNNNNQNEKPSSGFNIFGKK